MSQDLGEIHPLPSMTDVDPDALFRCPYDPSHILCAKRYTYHVAKCSLTHKKVAQKMRTCPFNARHRILRSSMAEHLAQCPDRTVGPTEVAQGAARAERGDGHSLVPQSSWEAQPCQEDWDAEMEEDGEKQPYIWGISAMSRSKTRPLPDMPVFAVPDYPPPLSSSRGRGARRGNNSAAGPSGRQLASTSDTTGSKHKSGNAQASASCKSRGGAAWQ
uniref:Gametocyte-specific factor 1-like n=2 Tax=Petromyzon marinus TaxID=7757 RepID=A0AAJ7TCS8_PETMA|nr:gametocyte-specific factor 1-like [Petromyzon marinus]